MKLGVEQRRVQAEQSRARLVGRERCCAELRNPRNWRE